MFSILTTAFLFGVVSNLHCFGMCGPIIVSIPLDRKNKSAVLIGTLQYHIGRILTYSLLGLIVGYIGLGIRLIGILQSVSIIAGFGIIIYAWRNYIFDGKLESLFPTALPNNFSSKAMGKVLRSNSPIKLGLLGMLNGILPCGMVYAALITAVITGSPLLSGTSMLFFGLGTLPGLMLLSLFVTKISGKVRSKINKYLPYILTIIGLMIILRGMNLGIPYLSPQAKISSDKNKIELKDCHTHPLQKGK